MFLHPHPRPHTELLTQCSADEMKNKAAADEDLKVSYADGYARTLQELKEQRQRNMEQLKQQLQKKRLQTLARLSNAQEGKSAEAAVSNRLAQRMTQQQERVTEKQILDIVKSGDVAALKRIANQPWVDLDNQAHAADYFSDSERVATAMHIAVDEEDAKMVMALIELGADPRAADAFGWSPLHHAVVNEDPEIASILLDAAGDHQTEVSETSGHEMAQDTEDSMMMKIFNFWHSHGKKKENYKGVYRVTSPNGIAYRERKEFGARVGKNANSGVYHNAIVKVVEDDGQWVQLTNGYYLPKYRSYHHDCDKPASRTTRASYRSKRDQNAPVSCCT